MQYKIYLPNLELIHIVKHYIAVSGFTDLHKLLFVPNGRNFMIFNRGISGYSELHNGEKFFLPKSSSVSIKAIKAKILVIDMAKHEDIKFPILLIELEPIGYYKIFQTDASQLGKKYLEIEEKFLQKHFSKLYTHKNINEEIRYVEKILLQINKFNERECIEDTLDKIKEFKYAIAIEELAREFGCSRRSLERNFQKYIGMSPKNYMQSAKFHESLSSYIIDNKSFNQMEFLYTDSSHFNVVSKRLTGKTPTQLYKAIKEKKEIRLYGIQD